MTVVVTGGAGFIGRKLVARLVRDGRDVVAVDRAEAVEALVGCEAIVADLVRDDLSDLFASADTVYHLAGRPGVRGDDRELEWNRILDNIVATEQVVRWTPSRVPLIYTSSSSVYGGTEGEPCKEDGPLAPRGGYAWSKLAAERTCLTRAEDGGVVTMLRLFTVLGELQRPDMALAKWVDATYAGREVEVFGGLERSRDFTDVNDVVDVLIKLRETPGPVVLNVGTGHGQTVGEMLDAIAEATGVHPRVRLVDAPSADPNSTLADPSRLTQFLGRALSTDLPDVVRRHVHSISIEAS